MQHASGFKRCHSAVGIGNHVHIQHAFLAARIRNGERLTRANRLKHAHVAPRIGHLDMKPPLKQHANARCHLARPHNALATAIRPPRRTKARQHSINFFRRNAPEQGRI